MPSLPAWREALPDGAVRSLAHGRRHPATLRDSTAAYWGEGFGRRGSFYRPERGQARDEAARYSWLRIEDLRMERVPGQAIPFPPIRGWRQQLTCQANSPADVTGYHVECSNATYLDFQISDCCLASDHWQLKGKSWDKYPNTAATTSPDLPTAFTTLFGLPARIYNYGGTGSSRLPKELDAYVECSYLDGIAYFPAGAFVLLSSDGNCTVTADTPVRRIDRTP